MRMRPTRLEFTIVSIGLLVLLLCSKPPQSGTADLPAILDPVAMDARSVEEAIPESTVERALPVPTGSDREAVAEPPRMGSVDARNCRQLGYDEVMYGEVTVQWVWNGTRFVPQKVCVVEEENGISSVWSFDQQDDAVLSEVANEPR
ncbi:MAG: hypothetical protein ACYTAS_10405 [Planctomycetota bacterium]|jgi:hypothetical protein